MVINIGNLKLRELRPRKKWESPCMRKRKTKKEKQKEADHGGPGVGEDARICTERKYLPLFFSKIAASTRPVLGNRNTTRLDMPEIL